MDADGKCVIALYNYNAHLWLPSQDDVASSPPLYGVGHSAWSHPLSDIIAIWGLYCPSRTYMCACGLDLAFRPRLERVLLQMQPLQVQHHTLQLFSFHSFRPRITLFASA